MKPMPLSGSVNVAHSRGGRGPLKGWTAGRERLLFGPRSGYGKPMKQFFLISF
jgi:hypothetical protein